MFVVFEGIDGTGKATQLDLLKNKLLKAGHTVSSFDFPAYESMVGRQIGFLLSKKSSCDANNLPPEIMSILFAVDRAQFKNELIKSINNDHYTICNRYTLSNIVFQSARNGSDLSEWVNYIERSVLELPSPDLYIVFNSTIDISTAFVSKKKKRNYTESADNYETNNSLLKVANQIYKTIQIDSIKKVVIDMFELDRIKSIEEIHKEVMSVISSFEL
jgi:dTMP kinase